MDIEIIIILIISGITVGFINTLAGGGTIISMSIFMLTGLPIIEAAGTNRIAVLMQNIVSTIAYRKQRLIDIKQATSLSVPIILGTLIGSQFTMMITDEIYTIFFMLGLISLGVLLIAKPMAWSHEEDSQINKTTPLLWIILFVSGIYSGSIYVGVGYIFISVFAVGYGYNLIKANALKGFMAMILTPVSLAIFILHGEVNYQYGIVHGLGNIIGAYFATKYARKLGAKFIKRILFIMIIISIIDLMRKPVFMEYINKIFNF